MIAPNDRGRPGGGGLQSQHPGDGAAHGQGNPPERLDIVGHRPVARLWRSKLTEAQAACAQRRARVLAHPDLAARLCAPPLGYRSPEGWNGFVPPRLCGEQLNASVVRRALVDLATEAMRRAAVPEGVADGDALGG
ncbi:hypothetical protein [Frankia sp. ACN1ag]|uniref:hypothetical protein n=1 Tax=Frankia sp. ACN1ag TaxID=102891 RepID=UPI0006DBF5B6|nr:hypothetical protein [Frankia sp. ACN1ag]